MELESTCLYLYVWEFNNIEACALAKNVDEARNLAGFAFNELLTLAPDELNEEPKTIKMVYGCAAMKSCAFLMNEV
jgi:hypothetical protein